MRLAHGMETGQDIGMAKRPDPPKRRGSATAAKSSGRRRPPKRQGRTRRILGWLVPLLLGLVVFAAGLTLDTGALLGLWHASLVGQFGLAARLAALAVLAACVAPAVIGAWRWLAAPAPLPPPRRKKPQQRTTTPRPKRAAKPAAVVITQDNAEESTQAEPPAPGPAAAAPPPSPRRKTARTVRPPRPAPR